MNGAEALLRTAAASGIRVCFANPGTTELPLVAALDDVPEIRPVLCLFEGVCSGAADGYARMSGDPALTLLHLGPGFANAIANFHNARRARSAIFNVIGDHATGTRRRSAARIRHRVARAPGFGVAALRGRRELARERHRGCDRSRALGRRRHARAPTTSSCTGRASRARGRARATARRRGRERAGCSPGRGRALLLGGDGWAQSALRRVAAATVNTMV
jgi:hypothetical protein